MNIDGGGTGSSKRPLSTFSPPSSVKRVKSDHDDVKLACYTPPPLPLTAAQGVERIPLLNVPSRRFPSEFLDRLASERTETLRAQGRHVVGLPVVLSDGIVLNWVRQISSSPVGGVGSHKVDHVLQVVRRNDDCWIGKDGNDNPHLSHLPSTDGDSGASAADAIIIDSDDDISSNLSSPRADESRDPLYNRGTSDQAVSNLSDSDVELPTHSEAQVKDDRAALRLTLAQELFPKIMSGASSGLPASGALPGERPVTARLRSDHTLDFEIDESDEELDDIEDIQGSTISARHANPQPLTSLQPIRELLARWKRRGDPERDVPPKGTVVAPEGSQKRERNEFLEEAAAITSSESDEESVRQASDPQLKRVPLPKTDYGRARRLLMPDSVELPLVAVTMRGDCHFIDRKKKFRITGSSLPNPGVFRHVGDVCMVGNTAVLGCDKGTHQISLVSVADKPQMIDVTWSPHSSGPRYQDVQKRGVSRLTPIHAEGGYIKFLSGGYDGTIHEWTAGVENLNEALSRKVVSHGACIMALAYHDRDRSVVASAQRRLLITDLNRCTTTTHPLSNAIQQIHVHPQAAHVTLLEVQHLDRQVLLYDSRKGNFDGEPCLSFGHRNANGKFASGHTRGSVHLVHFTKATEDGRVLLWDFRNNKRAVVERCFQQAEKVVHTIFADRDIATFGQGVVTFFEDYLAR